MRSASLALLLSTLLLAACGNPSRQELLTPYDPPGGEYRVYYLAPPWELQEADGTYLRLEIPATSVRLGRLDAGTVPPRFLCEVDVSTGTAANRARRDERDARTSGAEVVRGSTAVTTRDGTTGVDLVVARLAMDRTRFSRTVYLDRSGGGVVRMYFEANDNLQNPEVDAMIADVQVDPE